jgi:hypothetical protein
MDQSSKFGRCFVLKVVRLSHVTYEVLAVIKISDAVVCVTMPCTSKCSYHTSPEIKDVSLRLLRCVFELDLAD